MIHKKVKSLSLIAMAILLIGCKAETQYRGVSEPVWQQLSAEQKQLIVDQAYQNEFNPDSRAKKA